jgi:hypothetical protein
MTTSIDYADLARQSLAAAAATTAARKAVAGPSANAAEVFMAALRVAGRRENANGILVPGSREDRIADEKTAINSFVGYALGGSHGTQLDNARREAQRLLRFVAPRVLSAAPSAAGYVKGMPNPLEVIQRDIRARLDAAIEAGNDSEIARYQKALY